MIDDFASAVLVRCVLATLEREGVTSPMNDPGISALTPLADKRVLLRTLAERNGLGLLLSVGCHVDVVADDPAAVALLAAQDPLDLIARWSRLERFVHSRHRIEVLDSDACSVRLRHVSVKGGPPEPPEDALVAGVLAGLLAVAGGEGVTLTFGGTSIPLERLRNAAPSPAALRAPWALGWHALRPAVASKQSSALDLVARVRALTEADPARRWTVAGLARACGVSCRSLQRAAEPAGGVMAVVGGVRAGYAARLLVGRREPLALAGFASGYADQAHFTREFKKRTALTPARYAQAFAARAAGAPA